MTFLEKAKNDLKDEEFSGDGLPCKCPCKYGYEKEHNCSGVECEDCWNREMPNTEPQVAITKDDLELEYSKGLNDAWELAKKLWYLGNQKFKEIFGHEFSIDIIEQFTPQEALAKLKAYEEAQIKVGDVVIYKESGEKAVVVRKEGYNSMFNVLRGSGGFERWEESKFKKTGKHIDISSILEQIGE